MQGLFKLDSFIVEKIWGSKRLAELKNLPSNDHIGETYEVSTHASGNSRINEEELSKYIQLNYLIKFISTSDNLSIQVHPDDEYARVHENESGKTECWIILDAKPGAGIYLGFKKGVTKKEFKNAITSGLPIQNFLNFIPVKKGEFYVLPAGMVHALGSDITLCEIQQSSGVTYRVWDWDRVDDQGNSRELHIDQALDVLNFSDAFNKKYGSAIKENVFENDFVTSLLKHAEFETTLINASRGKHEFNLEDGESIIILEGEMEIDGTLYQSYESLIALGKQKISIELESKTSFLLTK